jgi:hypothetical protein
MNANPHATPLLLPSVLLLLSYRVPLHPLLVPFYVVPFFFQKHSKFFHRCGSLKLYLLLAKCIRAVLVVMKMQVVHSKGKLKKK